MFVLVKAKTHSISTTDVRRRWWPCYFFLESHVIFLFVFLGMLLLDTFHVSYMYRLIGVTVDTVFEIIASEVFSHRLLR